MLTELRISNFGVIEQLAVTFGSGFIVFTGETGAGKSLLIDAVTLLVGGRASADQIRAQADEADLEAAFQLPPGHSLLLLLQEKGFARPGETEMVIRRVISRTGRNRTYLNGNLCPVHLLEELGGALVDVHGQHEQQSLLSPSVQVDALDAYGRLHPLRQEYQTAHKAWSEQVAQLEAVSTQIARRREREDLLRFQFREISEAGIEAGEEAKLEQERPRLMHSQQLGECADQLHEALYAGEQSVLSQLASARKLLSRMESIDSSTADWAKIVDDAIVPLKELAAQVRHYRDQVEANPARLAEIEQRLDRLQRLSKKYGGSLEAMLDLQESLRAQLDQLDTAESHLQELTRAVEARRQNVSEAAERLTRKRSEAAKKLTAAVTKELGALRMERTRFLVEVSRVSGDEPYGLTGQDAVEFVFSANPGEPLKSLAKVASGGELSRVMLALKTILADTDRVPVLIFDEVDAGVGGAVAEVMGARLRDLSRHHQVLCVTHLPQVGSQAHAHYVVEKQVRQKRTLTQVRKLTSEEREAEIARMLAGVTVTKTARAAAAEMIESAKDRRS
ncbi:MAG TPA: DNA repair protein RecN [Nitrospira sp.]|nr:DNA repair protein RecN [Nitrospira sp.]MBS0175357.1 DNA repair protein RecN [Nitrospira sp.]MBX3336111.1 DNA repair protein RecN [Nitrospira sp.]MCW5778717.1 DNA repair protein RecN [Nitrospira sp.]HNI67146.1 DNA repair protein RecN [Nitrospira sp.]